MRAFFVTAVLSLTAMLVAPAPVLASDGLSCVGVGWAEPSPGREWERYIENTCNRTIAIAWCGGIGAERSHCRDGSNYYSKKILMDAGQRYFNSYSIPQEGELEYVACIGERLSVLSTTETGRYDCD
jgi:hypothetical protein